MNYIITYIIGLSELKTDINEEQSKDYFDAVCLDDNNIPKEQLKNLGIIIDDDTIPLIGIIKFLSGNPDIDNVICTNNIKSFLKILSEIKSVPNFVSFDFKLGDAKNMYKDTSVLYLKTKELFPNTPVIGYTNYESKKKSEAERLIQLFNGHHDSVYDKANINTVAAYDNIVRDKIRIAKILAEKKKLSEKNRKLVEDNKQLRYKSQLQNEEIEYITNGIENPLFEEIPLIGRSAPMKRIKFFIERLVNSYDPDNIEPIHLFGASGTGKENIAKVIHRLDKKRCHKNMVEVDCTAIPETLFESEMFGYEKGGHSIANTSKVGRFEEANGSTLFLDEIGDLTPINQTKLLKVLQDKKFRRIGGTKDIVVNFRLITATNHNLAEKVSKKRIQ